MRCGERARSCEKTLQTLCRNITTHKNHQRLSQVDLLIALVTVAVTTHKSASFTCFTFQTFTINSSDCKHTQQFFPFTLRANLFDGFTSTDLWSTVSMLGWAGYQSTRFLLQWQTGECDVQGTGKINSIELTVQKMWNQIKIIFAGIFSYSEEFNPQLFFSLRKIQI